MVERQSGVALWRQIADRMRLAINNGDFDETGMMPPEMTLAARFGVNRHTVRSAMAARWCVKPVQTVTTRLALNEYPTTNSSGIYKNANTSIDTNQKVGKFLSASPVPRAFPRFCERAVAVASSVALVFMVSVIGGSPSCPTFDGSLV